MLSTGLYGGGQGAQVVPSWMLPEDRSTWGRPQQQVLPQASPQPQQMLLPAQFQPQAQQPQGQNPYIQPVQPQQYTGPTSSGQPISGSPMGFIVPGNTQPLQPAPLSSNQRIPDMGVAQGTNPLYTQQQPQQPQDTGRWQRAQQLFNTPGYTNDPGFGGSAADQAKARQQNQQIAQNMFPQIYGNNGYGPTQGSGGQNSWQGNFDLPPGQLSGWMGDPGSNTPNYSTTNQNPFINSLGMNGIPLNSSQNNTYGTGGGQGPKGFAQWQGWGQNNLPPGQNFQPFQVSGNQGQIRGGFPQMNPQIQQILQLLMNYTPQNLQMALANGQFAIPGYTNPTPGKVNPMFMY